MRYLLDRGTETTGSGVEVYGAKGARGRKRREIGRQRGRTINMEKRKGDGKRRTKKRWEEMQRKAEAGEGKRKREKRPWEQNREKLARGFHFCQFEFPPKLYRCSTEHLSLISHLELIKYILSNLSFVVNITYTNVYVKF